MKVAMLCKFPSSREWGGVATHTRCLIKHLEEYEHRKLVVHVLSFGEKEVTMNLKKVKIVQIKQHWYYYIFPFLALLRLAREVQKVNPSIIHVQGTNISPYSLYAIFTPLKCKKLVTMHNLSFLERAAQGHLKRNSLRLRLIFQLEKLIIKKSDHVFVGTSKLKNYLIDRFNVESGKITVIFNGVDTGEFNHFLNGEVIRKKYGIKQNDFVLIFAKALVVNNGPQFVVRAFPQVLEKYPSTKLILVGEGPLKSELVKTAKQLHVFRNTIFTGIIPHKMMKYYLAASDAVVIPSVAIPGYEEGCSILMLEGMAMGKPVIASQIGGLREIIDGREIGILVPERDPQSIARAVIQIIEDPKYAKTIGEKARKYVTKEMTWRKMTEKTVELYEKLSGNT